MLFYGNHLELYSMLFYNHHYVHYSLVFYSYHYVAGLMQEPRNSIANALELRLSCTNPLMCAIPSTVFVRHHFVCYSIISHRLPSFSVLFCALLQRSVCITCYSTTIILFKSTVCNSHHSLFYSVIFYSHQFVTFSVLFYSQHSAVLYAVIFYRHNYILCYPRSLQWSLCVLLCVILQPSFCICPVVYW